MKKRMLPGRNALAAPYPNLQYIVTIGDRIMAVRNEMKRSSVRGVKTGRTRVSRAFERSGQRRKKITAMVPAQFLAGTPEYAKAVVGRWGKVISFEDQSYFLL